MVCLFFFFIMFFFFWLVRRMVRRMKDRKFYLLVYFESIISIKQKSTALATKSTWLLHSICPRWRAWLCCRPGGIVHIHVCESLSVPGKIYIWSRDNCKPTLCTFTHISTLLYLCRSGDSLFASCPRPPANRDRAKWKIIQNKIYSCSMWGGGGWSEWQHLWKRLHHRSLIANPVTHSFLLTCMIHTDVLYWRRLQSLDLFTSPYHVYDPEMHLTVSGFDESLMTTFTSSAHRSIKCFGGSRSAV